MSVDLGSHTGVKAQFFIWGYAVTGDITERSAVIAEARRSVPVVYPCAWDSSAADLAGNLVGYGDEPYRRVKDWSALPWMAEHIMRGHEKWPGL